MTRNSWPWPAGAATGIGSLPGTDIAEALRIVLGELPHLPHLPELPARGPGADLIGRAGALLADLPVEMYAARWRLATRPGRDLRAARDFLERDLDTLTDQAAGYAGTLKLQSPGPWTLAASLDLPIGGAVLRDDGAVRDLAGSLAEGLRAHVAEVRARLPRATVLVQLDEPSLPAVLAGRVPTESGLGTLKPVEPVTARAALAAVIAEADAPVVIHCCAAGAPLALLAASGAVGVALDLALVEDLDALAAVLDGGLGLIAGVADTGTFAAGAMPGRGPRPWAESLASRLTNLWRVLGMSRSTLPSQTVVSPACGLAGAPAERVRAVLTACREAARLLSDAPE
ncbi:MAG: methionine synthase [Dactylosporangium sp.]|nr:methionine synthase [Dactylosporangium sp.]NNJ59453.1 methionine synthase [Dactylosporangium sp.]